MSDADTLFTTGNGVTTTSRDEHEFVLSPQRGKAYADRDELRGTPSKCRKPLPIEEVWAAVAPKNDALRDAGHAELILEEVVGGRLYSGPAVLVAKDWHNCGARSEPSPNQSAPLLCTLLNRRRWSRSATFGVLVRGLPQAVYAVTFTLRPSFPTTKQDPW